MKKRPPNAATKRVLVAGGAGFIGSHLCERLLDEGHSVVCVDSLLTGSRNNIRPLLHRPDFRFIERDICNRFVLDQPVDEIYNLACAASPPSYQADPVHTMMTCVTGTANLLELADTYGASFVQASTSEVYGDPEEHPQREDYRGHVNCTGPRACYDEGKRAAEALCFDVLRMGRTDVRVARIFNTYGPRMRPDDGRIVSNLIVQALRGEPLTIYGTGEQTRSFCYVSDLVEGLVALMNAEETPDGPINLGNPGEFTINELAEKVLALTGRGAPIRFMPLPQDDPQRRRPDIAKALDALGWRPTIKLETGLARTVEWFRQALAGDESKATGNRPKSLAEVVPLTAGAS